MRRRTTRSARTRPAPPPPPRGLWERAAAEVAPGDTEGLHAITALLLDILQQSTTAVAEGYLAGFEATAHDKQDVHHSMLAALMERRGAEAAATLGFDLPPAYLVASLSFGTHPDEESPELDTVIATRRKLRRIRTALEYHGRDGTLSSVTATGGLALVPQPAWTDSAKDWQTAAELIRRTQRDVGVDVFAAIAVAAPAQVGDAVRETGEVLDVVRAFQRPPGTYRLADVLLEYQLTRPSAATDGLAAILAPMDDSPLLLETLRTFLSCGNNRRATATRLHVHPNSVDYRLRRVKELTGLDPTTPEGTQRIAAALAARTLAGQGGADGAVTAER